MSDFLEIDGSVLEGGGQILRIAISLSAIMGIPVRVTKIRAGRTKPGLAAQHLKGIQLVGKMCEATLNGAYIGSTEVEFRPGKLTGGQYEADPKTAGSVSLLLQVSLPCALFADSAVTLVLKGGTNADMAPQIDYMDQVFGKMLKKFGAVFDMKILRRGFFPRGGGHVRVEVNPLRQLHCANITDQGKVVRVVGKCFTAGTIPKKAAYMIADGAKEALVGIPNVHIDCYKEDCDMAPDNCSGIRLVCQTTTGCFLGGDMLAPRRANYEAVGTVAGEGLADELRSGAAVDSHTQDQLILYMALAQGKSVVRAGEITMHTQTAIHVAELIAKTKFNIQPDGKQNLIECTGLGFINENVFAK